MALGVFRGGGRGKWKVGGGGRGLVLFLFHRHGFFVELVEYVFCFLFDSG